MKKNLLSLMVIFSIIVCLLVPTEPVKADEAYDITISVNYKQTDARKMAEKLNEYRFNEGFDNESADPLSYDYNLEKAAMQRAAEIAIQFTDERPDGQSYKETLADNGFDISPRNILYGENIAFGSDNSMGLDAAFSAFCDNPVNKRNMLGYFTSVGIGHVRMEDSLDFWVMVFADEDMYNSYTEAVDGYQNVTIKVMPSTVDVISVDYVSGSTSVAAGSSIDAPIYVPTVRFNGSELSEPVKLAPLSFESSDEYVSATGGKITGLKKGTGTIKANLLGKVYSYSINVSGGNGNSTVVTTPTPTQTPSKDEKTNVGKTFEKSKLTYKVTSNENVELISCSSKETSITVPATVTYDGKKYKVNKIGDSAFSGNTKLKTIKLGSNVSSIGKYAFKGCTSLKNVSVSKKVTAIGEQAFYECKKLKKVTFKGENLTSVGSKAFAKISSKASVLVPKSVAKEYKKLLEAGGLNNKAKVSAY